MPLTRGKAHADVKQIATIAELRTHIGYAGASCQVLGYYAAGDGGGGPVRIWGTAGGYTDNGGSVIVPTGADGSGAWVFAGDGQSESFTVKIPSDYPTLQAAIDNLYTVKMKPGETITLLIESGHTIASQLIISQGSDCGHFVITSTDPQVTIDRSALTTAMFDRYPAFGADESGTLPTIDCLFTMSNTGTALLRDGVFVNRNSRVHIRPGAGVLFAGDRGLHVSNGSHANARESLFDDAGQIAFRVANGATASIRNSSGKRAGSMGLALSTGARVDANNVDVSGSLDIGASALDASSLVFNSGNASGSAGIALNIRRGSVCNAQEAVLSGSGGVFIEQASTCNLISANISGVTGDAVVVSGGSMCDAQAANISNASGSGLVVQNGSVCNAVLANCSSAGVNGVYCIQASNVNARQVDASLAVGTGLVILRGGIIAASSATGTVSHAVNTLTSNGIIFQ